MLSRNKDRESRSVAERCQKSDVILVFPDAPLLELSTDDPRKEIRVGRVAVEAIIQGLHQPGLVKYPISHAVQRFHRHSWAIQGRKIARVFVVELLMGTSNQGPLFSQAM